MRRILGVIGGLGLAVSVLVAAPGPAAGGGRVIKRIAYAPAEPAGSKGHLLDLYLPRKTGKPAPLIIWSHGSGWLSENGRDGADVVAARLNPHGYAVAGVAIRSSAHAQFPGQLNDIRSAIRFLRANAARFHLDPSRIGIMGESSGGWTAAMAAVTDKGVGAAVAFYPPTDFLRMDESMLDDCRPFNEPFGLTDCHADPRSPESLLLGHPITDRPDLVAKANPISYVSPADPPLLILHGQQDTLVPWQQGRLLYEAAHDATLVLLPNGHHAQWNGFLTDPAINADAREWHAGQDRPVQLSWDYVTDFFDRHLRAGTPPGR
ncbi:alpha/beta hydrolase [Paractinoplanes lichenicola]|uniref:Alpha/beta hydrolase n=1 Tax=Paractinoplanes lichenicola TaxID=2802976 RepID=A0ABS1VVQ9_9ACTN|nr:alpha/beta hydrolase [Actinoplanes lichenicola]MBL7258574.1 alpha/beta hydrolase [Actinoplanes lichenicola]